VNYVTRVAAKTTSKKTSEIGILINASSLKTESVREVFVVDGRNKNVPYVGPIRVSYGKRFCYVGACPRIGTVARGLLSLGAMSYKDEYNISHLTNDHTMNPEKNKHTGKKHSRHICKNKQYE
jgi:hypothetical protein